jgi:hypothetical protein
MLRITEVISLAVHINALCHAGSELFCLTAFKQLARDAELSANPDESFV